MHVLLPPVMFVAGKKKSGKDYLSDIFVEQYGYAKIHIAEPWLRQWFQAHGLDPDRWEALKAQYRAEIQENAARVRAASGGMALLEGLAEKIESLRENHPGVVVTAVRFVNEAQYALQHGYYVVKVETPDDVRRQRFIASGEDLAHFNDPFEAEVDLLPWHVRVSGAIDGRKYPYLIAASYMTMQQHRRAA